jgi:23S rRNA (guanosine2251-2'-O)-methyltransferase
MSGARRGGGSRGSHGGGSHGGGRPPRAGGAPSRPEARGLGGEQVEGRQAVRELLRARRRPIRDVWVSETLDESAVVAEILDLAAEAGVPIRRVARARLDAEARTEAPQGVLAHARPLAEADLADLCRAGTVAPFVLVLDGVTDPQNLGALLRTGDAAGVTGVVLARHRAAHVTPAVTKAAAGAIEHLPMAVVPGIPAALSTLREAGIWTIGLAGDATDRLWDLQVGTEPLALVLGAEGSGLARLTRARCDVVVSIPQAGRLASLNVAAAGAVAAFEIARRRSA